MLRKRGGSLSNKSDPKQSLTELENYYKSLKKNVLDIQYEFQIKKKEKSRTLIFNVKEKSIQIFKLSKKCQKKHIKKFFINEITQITKDKGNNKQITVEIITKKSKKKYDLLFLNTEKRENFYELVWLIKLNQELPEKELKVTYEKINIFISTWNMGDAPPPQSLDSWIPRDKNYDLVVIGVQECEYSPRDGYKDCEIDWFKTLHFHLGPNYLILESTSLVKMRIIIFYRKDHEFKFNYVEKTTIPTGIGGVYGNKGATLISFQFLESSFCFINSHFAAHQEKIDTRNNNYRDIIKNANLGYDSMDILNQFTHVFWIGDFNYRIDLFREEVLLNIKKKNLSKLLAADQLLNQKLLNKVFYNFKEDPLTFYPTYKMDRSIFNQYSEEKQRVPSWCDRILYKSLPYSQAIKTLLYTSAKDILTSDHRPVYGIYETYIQKPCLPVPNDQIKKCSIILNDLRAENLDLVEGQLPDPFLVFNSCSFIEKEISTGHASKNRSPNWGDIPPIHPMNHKQSFLETQHLYLTLFHGQDSIKLGHATVPLALGFSDQPFDFATRITKNGLPSGILYGKIQIIYSKDGISSPNFNLVNLKTIKNFKPLVPDLNLNLDNFINNNLNNNNNSNNSNNNNSNAIKSAPTTPPFSSSSPPPLPKRDYKIDIIDHNHNHNIVITNPISISVDNNNNIHYQDDDNLNTNDQDNNGDPLLSTSNNSNNSILRKSI